MSERQQFVCKTARLVSDARRRKPHPQARVRLAPIRPMERRQRNLGIVWMNHYRIALALTLWLVLLVGGFFLHLVGLARFPRGAVTLSSLTLVVLLGLWLQSYIFRYCGGVLFLVLGSWFIWTTYSDLGQRSALLDSYFFILGALYLFDGVIVLFSKPLRLNLSACVPRSRSTRRVLERCS